MPERNAVKVARYVLRGSTLSNESALLYMLRLCEEHLRKQKDKKSSEKTLPIIYPVILYTGNKKYTAPRSFYELFENVELAKKCFTEPVKVVDVHEIKDEELKERYLDTMLYIMRHIYAKDILKYIVKRIVNFEIIAKNNFSYLGFPVRRYENFH